MARRNFTYRAVQKSGSTSGISRQGLIKKINRYHIHVKDLRDEVYESL